MAVDICSTIAEVLSMMVPLREPNMISAFTEAMVARCIASETGSAATVAMKRINGKRRAARKQRIVKV